MSAAAAGQDDAAIRHIAALTVRVLTLFTAACSTASRGDAGESPRRQAIIYGEDDRKDLYETDEPFATLARDTAVALIAPSLLRRHDDGSYALDAPSYGELQSLCPGERFANQPAAASCSGVLVAPNLVATAGHCLGVTPDGSADCTASRYVFSFAATEPDASITIAADEVFDCMRVRGRLKTSSDSPCRFDVALIELDRPARGEAAIPRIRDRPLEAGEDVVVIGSTAGLPIKIDQGGKVIDARREHGDFFTLSSDTFAVSSGSGVFDSDGALVGLFARGRRDYDQDAGCKRVRREDEDGASGYEEATSIAAVEQLARIVTDGNEPLASSAEEKACIPADYLLVEAATAPPAASTCATARGGLRSRSAIGAALGFVVAMLVAVRKRTPRHLERVH